MLRSGQMLEVALGEDGSALEVSPAPGHPADDIIFPIDGLPSSLAPTGGIPAGRTAPETWTGGFSFAIWERRTRTITAYRDQYGARPLYYRLLPGLLQLAGDLPAILARLPGPPALDEDSVMEFLAAGVVSDGRTFHRGVLRLPAASRLVAGPGGPRLERYWEPWPGPRRDSMAEDDLDAEFRRRFRSAVASTLDDAEPFGVLLSGGPDSSAVLGMAARLGRDGETRSGPPRVALTMAFDLVRQCDEGGPASETARFHGVPWRSVPVEPHSPMYGFDAFLERFGEPPCAVNIALESLLLEAARREGVRVLLDGHDADALFIPSPRFLSDLIRRGRGRRLLAELRSLRSTHGIKSGRLARTALASLAPEVLKRVRRRAPRWLNRNMVRRTSLEDRLRAPNRPACFEQAEAERVLAPVVGLGLEAVRCLERMHGVDGRHPFFDPRLVNFLASIPFELRFTAAESKLLMRRALADLLAPTVRKRVDKTNYTPYFDWSLRHHLGSELARLAERGSEALQPFVDWDLARPLIRSYLSGKSADRLSVWRMLALERWLVLKSGSFDGGIQREGPIVG